MWCFSIGLLLWVCYGWKTFHSLAEMKILGAAAVIASGGVAADDLEMASTSTPNFPDTYLPPSSDCLNLCFQPLSPPPSLPLLICLHLSLHFFLYLWLRMRMCIYMHMNIHIYMRIHKPFVSLSISKYGF